MSDDDDSDSVSHFIKDNDDITIDVDNNDDSNYGNDYTNDNILIVNKYSI